MCSDQLRRLKEAVTKFREIFKNKDQTQPLFVYFRPFSLHNCKYCTKFNNESIDGVLRTLDRRRIHWAMAAPRIPIVRYSELTLLFYFKIAKMLRGKILLFLLALTVSIFHDVPKDCCIHNNIVRIKLQQFYNIYQLSKRARLL